VRLEELGQLKKANGLIGSRNRDHPASSIVPQPTTLPRAPYEVLLASLNTLHVTFGNLRAARVLALL
jgi:hypothetical protein